MTTEESGRQRSTERRLEERLSPREIGLPVELGSLNPDRKGERGELINVSAGGMAVWLAKPLDTGSHWLLAFPDMKVDPVPVKMLSVRPGFGGHIHGFKFSVLQPTLADRLARLSRRKP